MPDVTIDELKRMLVENCMLKVDVATIEEDTPLFGPDSVGLDSLDALQMSVALEKAYGVQITDQNTARDAFQSLGTLRDWLRLQVPPEAGGAG
jgi:acyl carrier protein